MAKIRPKGYPKLKNYKPSAFMLPSSHYDTEKADRAVRFIENFKHTKGRWDRQAVLAPALAGTDRPRYLWDCR